MDCNPGQYLDSSNRCRDCELKTFSSTKNRAGSCSPCAKNCFDKQNAEIVTNCSSTHDLICRCKNGYYARHSRHICRRHTVCPQNCIKAPGTSTSDTICYSPCPYISSAIPSAELSTNVPFSRTTGLDVAGMLFETQNMLDLSTGNSEFSLEGNSTSTVSQPGHCAIIALSVITCLAVLGFCFIALRKRILCFVCRRRQPQLPAHVPQFTHNFAYNGVNGGRMLLTGHEAFESNQYSQHHPEYGMNRSPEGRHSAATLSELEHSQFLSSDSQVLTNVFDDGNNTRSGRNSMHEENQSEILSLEIQNEEPETGFELIQSLLSISPEHCLPGNRKLGPPRPCAVVFPQVLPPYTRQQTQQNQEHYLEEEDELQNTLPLPDMLHQSELEPDIPGHLLETVSVSEIEASFN